MGWKSCTTTELYKLGAKTEDDLLFKGEWKPTDCHCPKQCYENIYTVYTEALQTGKNAARLRIFFQVRKKKDWNKKILHCWFLGLDLRRSLRRNGVRRDRFTLRYWRNPWAPAGGISSNFFWTHWNNLRENASFTNEEEKDIQLRIFLSRLRCWIAHALTW